MWFFPFWFSREFYMDKNWICLWDHLICRECAYVVVHAGVRGDGCEVAHNNRAKVPMCEGVEGIDSVFRPAPCGSELFVFTCWLKNRGWSALELHQTEDKNGDRLVSHWGRGFDEINDERYIFGIVNADEHAKLIVGVIQHDGVLALSAVPFGWIIEVRDQRPGYSCHDQHWC